MPPPHWNNPDFQRRRAEMIERHRQFDENVKKSEANLKAQQEQYNQFVNEQKQFKLEETQRLKELEEDQFKQQEDTRLHYIEEERRRCQLRHYNVIASVNSDSLHPSAQSIFFNFISS